MSSDIVSELNLHDNLMQRKFLLATKDLNSDLNFFFSEFLSCYVKKNYSIIIVNLAQSYSHYTHLLLKSGINIKVLRDSQKVAFVNIVSEAGNLIESASQTEAENTGLFNSLNKDCCDSKCLKPLFECIKSAVEKVCAIKPDGFIIFIDEINLLMNLGASHRAIQPFVQQCYALCSRISDIPGNLLIGSVIDKLDHENRMFINYLIHLADVEVEIEGLKTGYSKDIDGKITIEVTNKSKCTSNRNEYFFKVSDKGAKIWDIVSVH